MEKLFKLEGLDCANCGAKIENKINKMKEVNDANVNFMSEKLILDIDEEKCTSTVLEKIFKTIKKIDKGINIKEL